MRMRLVLSTLIVCLVTAAQNKPTAFAHDNPGGATHADMASAARDFLASLTPPLRAKATLPYDSKQRTNWHFVPKERLGVSLREMDLPQRRAAHRLLRSALSGRGYLKATTIMSLEQVLRVLESERPGAQQMRDQEKYWFAIFAVPAEDTPWGWRVEGHHVSLNFSSASGVIIASTPMFLGANPAEVPSGPRAGLRVLAAEEDLARALLAALPEADRKKAIIAAEAPRDIFTGPGQKLDLGQPAGLTAAEMPIAARRLLWSLITEYATNLRPEVAAKELAEIRGAGVKQIHFAWAGATRRGEGHYYRIHGPTFIIEYDNTQNNANHIHTVWHSLNNDFGLDSLRRHYQESPHHAAGR